MDKHNQRTLKIGDIFKYDNEEFVLHEVFDTDDGVRFAIALASDGVPLVVEEDDIEDEVARVVLLLPKPVKKTIKKGKK